ncbi:MAG TPA: UdgX family uracil-DNA binding protein [Reyranella sp.]|nr:UdgX family uracil-DNA binding protein [Reyranella sp.]
MAKLTAVAKDAKDCTRCPLYRNATQTVFGEGPATARIMMVGEQPGDQEDLQGHPFVGPAGRELDKALQEVGLDRKKVYVTNAVKHFKNEPRGKKRLHKRPNRYEVEKCRWWLDQEIAIVQPDLILALGVTAANILTGKSVTISRQRGQVIDSLAGHRLMVTAHPSSILRMPDEPSRRKARAALVDDLKKARKAVAEK